MPMQIFGELKRCIMGFVQVVNAFKKVQKICCLLNWCYYLLRRVFRTFSHKGTCAISLPLTVSTPFRFSTKESAAESFNIQANSTTWSVGAFHLHRCGFSFLRLGSQHSQRFPSRMILAQIISWSILLWIHDLGKETRNDHLQETLLQ